MVTFLKACNNFKGQGRLMIFYHPRDGDLPRDGGFLGMATIISMMTNDHPWDGGHPWDCLGDFDHFWVGDLPWDCDHPKCGRFLRDLYHPKGWLLSFGSKES